MDEITVSTELAIGSLGVLLGLGSLITTVVLWRRSGPRVTVEARVMMLISGSGQALTDVIQVTARNTGRAATTIDNWGLQLPSGGGLVVPNPEPKTHTLPHRLEAEGSASWYVSLSRIEKKAKAEGADLRDLKAWVALGSGRKIESKNGIQVKLANTEPAPPNSI